MKYILTIFLLSNLICSQISAQSVLISDTSSYLTPNSSSVLDVFSFNKGVLLPRINDSTLMIINNPAEGLIVYKNVGSNKGYYYYNGNNWVPWIEDSIGYINIDKTFSSQQMDSIAKNSNASKTLIYYQGSLENPLNVSLWNKNQNLFLGNNNCRFYKNYNDFRADTFSQNNLAIIQDFIYTYNNKSYSTKGGLFIRSQNDSIENGGTKLKKLNNDSWSRVILDNKVFPEWWEVGGYDLNGKKFLNDYKLDGIQDDGDRLSAACAFSNGLYVIELSSNYIYEHKKTSMFLSKGQIINGNNATIKRKYYQTSLTNSAIIGSPVFNVVSASEFRVGMKLCAFIDSTYGNQSISTPSWSHTITAIVGNQIFITPNVQIAVNAGGKVQVIYDQIIANENCIFNDIIFDGNSDSMNATNSWTHLSCIKSYKKGLTINNCKFYNMPSDVIIAPSELYINNCYIENLYGSFIHGSSGLNNSYESQLVRIVGLKGKNICKVPASTNGHSNQYGLYTQSIATSNLIIENSYIVNGNYGGIATPLTGSSDYFSIINSTFENFGHIVSNISTTGIKDFQISGCNFINCGVLNFEASINSNAVYSNTRINNNSFKNSQLVLSGVSKININDNIFLLEKDSINGFINFNQSKETFNNSNSGALILLSGEFINFHDNILISKNFDSRAFTGIKLYSNQSYNNNIIVNNNRIVGFNRGIELNYISYNSKRENIFINNNSISTEKSIEYTGISYGARIGNGTQFKNNYIKHIGTGFPLLVYGVSNSGVSPTANIVTNNTILGDSSSIKVFQRMNYLSDNTLSHNIVFENSVAEANTFSTKNNVFNVPNVEITEYNKLQSISSGNVLPTLSMPNGSLFILRPLGDLYIRLNGIWKKILTN